LSRRRSSAGVAQIPALDLFEDLPDFAYREVVSSRGPYSVELLLDRLSGLPPARGPQRLSHPFGDSHAITPGDVLDVIELLFVQQDLKSLTHVNEYDRLVKMSQGKRRIHDLHAQAMLDPGLKAYLLLGIEPEFDCASPAQALRALRQAEWVVSLSAYRTSLMEDYADVLLPIALFAENGGHFVNAAGERQGFKAAVPPLGEARPAWKILRVLGNHFDREGFEYVAVEEVALEVGALIAKTAPDNEDKWLMPTRLERAAQDSLQLVSEVPIYSLDPLVRRAGALQQILEAAAGALYINQALADALGLSAGDTAALGQNGSTIQLSETFK
jgi:NADH dehydrogenase/NADH:ubiquinone oxidoreductase subunit G